MYENILNSYSAPEIVQICKYLNKDYNIYEPDEVRWKKIKYAFSKTSEKTWLDLQKKTFSNEFINFLFMKYYSCERVVKYHFIKHLKDAAHDIVAFEMSIGDSRIDICRINGNLCAYEIKTEYDNYDRLSTQMDDYFNSFEKVYIIVPIEKADMVKNHIPEKCGIITYRKDISNDMVFSYHRAAQKSNCDITFCLKNLSSGDLIKLLKMIQIKPLKTKEDNLALLLDVAKKKNVLPIYRRFVKSKYKEQWCYLKNNFDNILPIDCQSFFSSRMDPNLLYEKNSHMA